MTRAPVAAATWIRHMPTAPLAPVTATVSPGRSRARRMRTPYAVAPGCTAAMKDTGSAPAGSRYSRFCATGTSSAVAPGRPP